ncbi:MAG: flagellar basal body rod protein FlgC [Buchnera aphidicola (Pentalonia nigronervosa)]|jgi:flagellar basal-body rod protein FlgC|uniref:Flagellar basal-body rod protein FlgC n=1 Tax=Buchnera aphidicola (Pentalonia nigronervosa) TaxID=1309793 RepID=A0A7H1AZW1_9GAMM|nr:MAG: flagellar basal body rod protein FlgC [Buchnera aphidicola (Pentalonia nigronervosa)]
MSFLNVLDIANSAMIAQSKKIEVIASNLANMDSFTYKHGKFYPYIGKKIIFQFDPIINSYTGGVKISHVINDDNPIKIFYDPNNPTADKQGYVTSSNVNPISEMVNNISASRNYQANVEVLKTAKTMIMKTLTIND